MAEHVISGTKVLIGGHDYSPGLSQVQLTLKKEGKDNTSLDDEARSILLGFQSLELTYTGFLNMDADDNHDQEYDNWGAVDTVLTVCPENSDVESIAYFTKKCASEMSFGGAIGEVTPFNGAGYSSGQPIVRGQVLATGAKTETENGAAVEAGAVGATEYLYGALHVTAVSGTDTPTATVKIQSAPTEDFASPTDRISFTAATAATSQWATPVAGAITDTYWRAVVTISGTNPSITLYCALAIQ